MKKKINYIIEFDFGIDKDEEATIKECARKIVDSICSKKLTSIEKRLLLSEAASYFDLELRTIQMVKYTKQRIEKKKNGKQGVCNMCDGRRWMKRPTWKNRKLKCPYCDATGLRGSDYTSEIDDCDFIEHWDGGTMFIE
jgi:hypothetical protein